MTVRQDCPPGFNSVNLLNLGLTAGPNPHSTMSFGSAVECHLDVCGVKNHKYFVGLFEDESGCALVDINAELMDSGEPCMIRATRAVTVDVP